MLTFNELWRWMGVDFSLGGSLMKRNGWLALAGIVAALVVGCATAAPTDITVMTYNIRVGLGVEGSSGGTDPRPNLAAIAQVIEEAGADIVLLQEVDRGTQRTSEVDEAAWLADRLGMHGAFAKALDLEGGEYGIAVLSAYPIIDDTAVPLAHIDYVGRDGIPEYYSEQRMALVARLDVDGELLTVVDTHLGLTQEQRALQLEEIAEIVNDAGGAVIFGGDLNCEPDAPELLPVREVLRDCYQGHVDDRGLTYQIPIADRLTFHSTNPTRCIDFLFVSPDAFDVGDVNVIETAASDHRPVVVELTSSP